MARNIDYTPAFEAAEYVYGKEPIFTSSLVRCKNCGSVSQMKKVYTGEDAGRKRLYETWKCGCGATAAFTFAKIEEIHLTKEGTRI